MKIKKIVFCLKIFLVTMSKMIWVYGLFFVFGTSKAELFTATVDLEKLVETEGLLIKSVISYMKQQQKKLNLLKKYVNEYISHHNVATQNVQRHVANPINSFLLVKKLVSDWKIVKELINGNMEIDILDTFLQNNVMPNNEDLNGAAVAISRLQKTYNLETTDFASGKIKNTKYSPELSADVCFEIGKQIFLNNDYYYSLLWMQEADRRIGKSINGTVKRQEILDYISFIVYKLENTPLALNVTNEWLKLEPNNTKALKNKSFFEKLCLQQNKTSMQNKKETLDLSTFITKSKPKKHKDTLLYQQLCRNEVTLSEKVKAKLTCYYEMYKDPYLTIAPFKVEEAYKDPKIVIFHDVLSNKEIETIKIIALPKFARAGVRHHNTSETIFSGNRISKLSWLKNTEHECIEKISKRVGHMTQLDQKSADNLQVVNYGIGGHYEPHYDFTRKGSDPFSSLGIGNRMATVLFYMSDVEQGGATAFTNIKTAVFPKKGTAVLWFNLFPNGEGNALTKHAACPVLVGSKWVCNKWIHEYHQEFRRPCDLKPTISEFTA